MRALVLTLVAVVAWAGVATAQEAHVTLDLDAFADDVADALGLEHAESWEEHVDPAVERAWLAGRSSGAAEDPEVVDADRPATAPIVGLTLRAGDLTVTRLVASDLAQGRAWLERLSGGFAPPLGTGPSGARVVHLPALLELRGRHLLLIRGPAALDGARWLAARRAAWDAAGLPATTEPSSGIGVVDDGLEVFVSAGEGPLRDRIAALDRAPPLRPRPAGDPELERTGVASVLRHDHGVGLRAIVARGAQAERIAGELARALEVDIVLPPARPR